MTDSEEFELGYQAYFDGKPFPFEGSNYRQKGWEHASSNYWGEDWEW